MFSEAVYNVCNTTLSPGRVHLVEKGIADAISIGLPVLGGALIGWSCGLFFGGWNRDAGGSWWGGAGSPLLP